jgi:hypothetical protein
VQLESTSLLKGAILRTPQTAGLVQLAGWAYPAFLSLRKAVNKIQKMLPPLYSAALDRRFKWRYIATALDGRTSTLLEAFGGFLVLFSLLSFVVHLGGLGRGFAMAGLCVFVIRALMTQFAKDDRGAGHEPFL